MNTQLPGPRHARADVGRAHRGRSLLAAAAASLLALTGLGGVALASDEEQTPAPPSVSEPSPQTDATEGGVSSQDEPADGAVTSSPGPRDSSTAAPGPGTTALSTEPTPVQARDVDVQPLAAGPDGPQLTTPYVYWTVQTSTGSRVGGATVTLQGPRSSNSNWGASVNVLDNFGQTGYSGPDLDPDPGEFAVHAINGTVLSTSSRYRIQQQTPPAGYVFTGNSGVWLSINGNRNSPSSGEWSNGTHGFGAITVAPAPTNALHCEAGWVYSVSSGGQLRSVNANSNGTVATVGAAASNVSSFNGLGIGRGGSPVYAYERSGGDEIATIWSYDTGTGRWTTTNDPYDTNLGNSLVAGAVDLATGQYFFGGFTSNGQQFRVYSYNPGQTPRFAYVGWIDTNVGTTTPSNGDMAFSSNGDLWVVRGSGTTTTVFSVTAANLTSALSNPGNQITASPGTPISKTANNVNGVAFDSAGLGYLGNDTTISSWNVPAWTSSVSNVTSQLSSSTDLASCSSPASITVQKVVQGRVSTTDQFTLTLSQGATALGTATTTGSANGLQTQEIGPLPTGRVALNIFETASGTTNVADYASAWSCAVDGVAIPGASGTGRSGTVTIPSTGQDVLCQFTNSPLVANVTINKQMQDINGENPAAQQGWTVGAATTPNTGTATASPAATTQQTDSSGKAAWRINFDTSSSTATVAVSETMQAGYSFVSGSCTVTTLTGDETTTPLSGPQTQGLAGVGPGDSVDCTYTNKPSPATLTLVKSVDNRYGGTAQPTDWTLAATGQQTITGTTGSAAVTNAVVTPGTYTLSESGGPAGYRPSAWACSGATVSGNRVTLTQGATVTCSITNSNLPGSVTWEKVSDGGDALNGSTWSLVGPDGSSSTTVLVDDCVQNSGADCKGADKDPAGGRFRVENLSWGAYTLTETEAPAGYVRDTSPHKFTISADSRDHSFDDPFVNSQVTPPALPLTGGLGTDTFLMAGGGLLALAGIGGWIHRRRSLRVQRA